MVAVFVLGAATVGTVVINVRKNAVKKRATSSMFEEEARRAASKARVEGIEAMLKEMKDKAENAEAKLDAALKEKNAIERVLEEMERTKSNLTVENIELRDSVTVLKNDLEAHKSRHSLVVRKWRDELVTYREKSPADFLAEVIGLVSDMDNEVTIEVIPPEVAAAAPAKSKEEVRLDECEWDYNPRLAVADSTRLLMLASSGRTVNSKREAQVNKYTSIRPMASPRRATTPTRMALGKLTNSGTQRANAMASKAVQLVHPPSQKLSTPPKVGKADRSIEFGECLLFEKDIQDRPIEHVGRLNGARSGVVAEIAVFESDDFVGRKPSNALALRR